MASWKPNVFKVPSGASGKALVSEITRLIDLWVNKTKFEAVAIAALQVFGTLMLQKPSKSSKNRDHIRHLTIRLKKWENGEFDQLVSECEAIQQRLTNTTRKPENIIKVFSRLMLHGKVSAAMRWLGENKSLPLKIDRAVKEALRSKHPDAEPVNYNHLLQGSTRKVEPVIFENIDASAVERAAKLTRGSAGPSGLDSDTWRRILCSKSFGKCSMDACDAVARMCRRLCTEYVDPKSISSLLACRLIPLDKNPGVRPIGIGEVLRRILGKTVSNFLKIDIIDSVGPLQLAAGQDGGCEAAIHAMNDMFKEDNCEGVLMVDATNAYNSLNRATSLLNLAHICPEFAVFLINTYRLPSKLFLPGGTFILSNEGTTQGDNCASGFYSVSISPIISQLSSILCKQLWYADDSAAAGLLQHLREWWDCLLDIGPGLGYFPNAKKTWLVVKPQHFDEAVRIFKDTGVQVTKEGQRYLGAAIGTNTFKEEFVKTKVETWISELKSLTEIAKVEPQLAYSAFTFGLSKRWLFVMRTMENIGHLFQPLENCIRDSFLPELVKQQLNEFDRTLFSLPAKFGGLGIFNPTQICEKELKNSHLATKPLVDLITEQIMELTPEDSKKLRASVTAAKSMISNFKRTHHMQRLKELKENIGPERAKHVDNLCRKGTSAWLTSLPLEDCGFTLNKQEFRDALHLRYNFPLKGTPTFCSCGERNTLDHSLVCKKGGFVSMRHNQIRDLEAMLMSEVCKDVQREPPLLPLSGEMFNLRSTNTASEARLDISARGIWNTVDKTFFDVRVFHPGAESNKITTIEAAFEKHEQEKKRTYNRRILEVEKATFTPLVFSTTGGMGKEAEKFHKRLASLLSEKRMTPYSDCMSYLRRKLSFCLLRTVLAALRGYRGQPAKTDDCNMDINLLHLNEVVRY